MVLAVIKLTGECQISDITEAGSQRFLVCPYLDLAHSRGIDEHPAAIKLTKLSKRGGMPTTAVTFAHRTGVKMIVSQ